jgi:6-phosphogluconate dehydrogenase
MSFDSYRSANLPANLTQTQRDLTGAHTREQAGRPGEPVVHPDWKSLATKYSVSER